MDQLRVLIQLFANFIGDLARFHKMKVLSILIFAIIFALLIFPFDDLSLYMTTKVAEESGNTVYLQADELGLSILPIPGAKLEGVTLDTNYLPTLNAATLRITPSFSSLLIGKIGGSFSISDLLKAEVSGNAKQGKTLESGGEIVEGNVEIENLSLKELKNLFALALNISGSAQVTSEFKVDRFFTIQPEGEFDITVNNFILETSTIEIPMGDKKLPVSVPAMKFSKIQVKGRLVGEKIELEEVYLGDSNDPVHGRLRGQLDFKVTKVGKEFRPSFGPYELFIELNTTKQAESDLIFLSFIDQFRRATSTGGKFLLKAKANSFGPVPKFAALPRFEQ